MNKAFDMICGSQQIMQSATLPPPLSPAQLGALS